MDIEANTSSVSTNEDNQTNTQKTKLGICEVCGRQEAKYCCPKCEVKTCSLKCSKIHKAEVECDGVRDRAKFIPINKFTNLDFSSDYRLLEEISRAVDGSKRGRFTFRYGLNKRFLLLQKHALERKIPLKFLPTTFARHKLNSSRFDIANKLIEWHVDWIFVNSENFKISEERVSENVKISSHLQKYLVKQDNEELQEKLQYYQAADLSGIKVLLKAEQKPGTKFYEIDPTLTLKECLRNKVIIEYPTVHLVLKEQASFYDVIDSDDEDEDCKKQLQKQMKSGHEVINKIIKKSESDSSLYESLKNLLFVSEYSDEEQGENE